MELQVVRKKTADVLKHLGYREPVINFFDNNFLQTRYQQLTPIQLLKIGDDLIAAPYLDEVIKWLRDTHQIYVNIECLVKSGRPIFSFDILFYLENMLTQVCQQNYNSFEDAQREAIKQALYKVKK